MDLSRARFVASKRGLEAVEALPPEAASLPLHQLAARLRRDFVPSEAAAVAEQLVARARARARFGELPFPCFSPDGLEMMTHPVVAARRAARIRTLDLPAADLTCGIGGDLSAMAAAGIPATALERDVPTALLAAANVPSAAVVAGDAARPPFALGGRMVLVDPSRREGHTRRWDPSAFFPAWDVALAAAETGAAGVVKAPPGIGHEHIPAPAEAEFVQLGRSMREAALWFGRGAVPGLRRAVLLPEGAGLTSLDPEVPVAAPSPIGDFLLDPESCVTRAGLVRQLAAAVDGRLLDPNVAYLTAPGPASHPLATTFEVVEVMPFSLARLRDRLRRAAWVPREIRRRAFPIEPDELRRLLGKLEGDPITLLCTTLAGRRTVVIARPCAGSAPMPVQETATE